MERVGSFVSFQKFCPSAQDIALRKTGEKGRPVHAFIDMHDPMDTHAHAGGCNSCMHLELTCADNRQRKKTPYLYQHAPPTRQKVHTKMWHLFQTACVSVCLGNLPTAIFQAQVACSCTC